MPSVIAITLCDLLLQTLGKQGDGFQRLTNQDPMLAGTLVDRLKGFKYNGLGKSADLTFKLPLPDFANLDNTVLGKTSHVATIPFRRPSLPLCTPGSSHCGFASSRGGYMPQQRSPVIVNHRMQTYDAMNGNIEHEGEMLRRSLLKLAAASVMISPASALALSEPSANEDELQVIFKEAVGKINEQLMGIIEIKTKLVLAGEENPLMSGLIVPETGLEGLKISDTCVDFYNGRKPYEVCSFSAEENLKNRGDYQKIRECCLARGYTKVAEKWFLLKSKKIPQPTVVLSRSILSTSRTYQTAVLWHELGHVSDFVLFGSHYKLLDHLEDLEMVARLKSTSEEQREKINSFATKLNKFDCANDDPEDRADILSNLLIAQPQGKIMCYEKKVQANGQSGFVLIDAGISPEEYEANYADHSPHGPIVDDNIDFKPRKKCGKA